MVKCEMWQIRQWPPLCLGSIILASDSNRGIDDGQISNSDGSSSWITVNLGVCSNLMNIRQSKTRLFLQFPDSALFRSLIHVHETTGKCPCTLERRIPSLDK